MSTKTSVEVEVDGRRLKLSNLDKVLYPEVGFTKGQVIDYYRRIAPAVLPHLNGRPLTMKRYPDGVDGKFFYEKQKPKHAPDWVKSARIKSETSRPFIDFILANDLPTLVWLANMADIELHTSLSHAKPIEQPTMLAYDLDPGSPAGLVECAEVALLVRDLFAELGMECFPKTSGSKGMQVYVPLNTKGVTYEDTKPFSKAIAQILEKQHPKKIVSKQTKALRKGKVLIDWSQNAQSKTTVSVYSLRARERPTVSTPLAWDEVEQLAGNGDPESYVFEAFELCERYEERGDLFEPVLELRQKLPDLTG